MKFNIKLDTLRKIIALKKPASADYIQSTYGSPQKLCHYLDIDPRKGLNDADVIRSARAYGSNKLAKKKPKTFLHFFLVAGYDRTLIALTVAAIVLLFVDILKYANVIQMLDSEDQVLFLDGMAIISTVLIVIFVTAMNDWQKEKQFQGLAKDIEAFHRIDVIRNGALVDVPFSAVVVGDIGLLKGGDLIPADGVVLQSSELTIDESSLTGESWLVRKDPKNPIILSHTYVIEGSGKVLFLAVGANTLSGRTMGLMTNNVAGDSDLQSESQAKSLLQKQLGKIMYALGIIGSIFAAIMLIMRTIRFSIIDFTVEGNTWTSSKHLTIYLGFLIESITLLVVAIPEGLPLAITIALAYSVKKMAKDNNLVRHLHACETMGNATTICSDKTGTLTTNHMTVTQFMLGRRIWRQWPLPEKHEFSPRLLEILARCVILNIAGSSRIITDQEGRKTHQGNKTECALLGLLHHLQINEAVIRKLFPESAMQKSFAFSSRIKCMATVYREDFHLSLFVKGAPEVVLPVCTRILNKSGEPENLTTKLRASLDQQCLKVMANDGLRTIAIAFRKLHAGSDLNSLEKLMGDMILVAVVGIEDPVRPDVPLAIRVCQNAGITVRMVTGDSIATAISIARKAGIIGLDEEVNEALCMDSQDFNRKIRDSQGQVDQDQLDKVWPKLRVLARSLPMDKYVLVDGIMKSELTEKGEVVAVTGDGTNDGPALKIADVGFAMGVTGTEVAKEASDIILTDDNFSSIVKAVLWGRNISDCILKFLQFQLTVNIVAVLTAFIGSAVMNRVPLKAVQMLWVNMIMDSLASLALATQTPTEDLLMRKPSGRKRALISPTMLRHVLGQAVYQVILICVLLFRGPDLLDYDIHADMSNLPAQNVHFTMVFNTFIMMTLFNEVACRKIHGELNFLSGLKQNRLFIVIWVGTLILQVCSLFTPPSVMPFQFIFVNFGGRVTSTVRLELRLWLWSIMLGMSVLFIHLLLLLIPLGRFGEEGGDAKWHLRTSLRKSRGDSGFIKQNEAFS